MKFTKIMGNVDHNLVLKAEEKLSQVFLELATRYNNEHVGTGLGGDPLVFSLVYPMEHICTLNISTAATDGKRYYWNPKFILKKSKKGLRIVCNHEAFHAIYLHPQRRGSRIPKLWNIAVDYIVNGTCMEDLKARKQNVHEVFTKELGRYMPLMAYAEMLKNPFVPVKGYEDLTPSMDQDPHSNIKLPKPGENRDLTPEEQKELERREKAIRFFYADPDLQEEMKRPEKIYDFLYNLLPKCPKCGSVGIYQKPKDKKDKKKDKGDQKGDQKNKSKQPGDQGDGDQPGEENQGKGCGCGDEEGGCSGCEGEGGCPNCDGGFDVFNFGGTLDDHIDTEETQEKLAKRISDAMEAAQKMAGHVPGALEDELGKLTAPKVTWQDIIRTRILKSRSGNGKNDWTRFRTRPMFAGMLVPKRRDYYSHFGCLLDTSGSMSQDDMAYGLSQLQSLDERAEGVVTPCDCTVYWDQSTKLRNCKPEEISKVKVTGRGGTRLQDYFNNYEKNIGTCDFLIVISDLYLCESEWTEMKDPGIPVYWLCTSANTGVKVPFGRVMDLRE